VQKNTGRTIQPVVIHDNEKPGQNLRNGQLQIYRPQVQVNDANGRRPAPSNVVNLKDVKRSSERNAANPILGAKPAATIRQNAPPARSTNVAPIIVNKQKEQPARPANATPTMNNRQRVQPARPTNVIPTMNNRQKVQAARPTNVTPAMNNKQKEQPSRSVNPPHKVQQQQPRIVNPPKEYRAAQPSPPKNNRDENENGKR